MPFLSWGICKFSFFFPTFEFSMPNNLLSFDPHSLIWESFKTRFFEMSGSSSSLSSNFSSHLQRWDRSCFCRSYHPSGILDELKACHLSIASIFFQNSCPFLSRAIGDNNSNPIPFQAHFKWARDLLPPTTQISILPFEQMLKRGMNRLQESISKSMHKHSLSNIISKLFLDCHHVQLRSYTCPIQMFGFLPT
jgi:hypothetical protein